MFFWGRAGSPAFADDEGEPEEEKCGADGGVAQRPEKFQGPLGAKDEKGAEGADECVGDEEADAKGIGDAAPVAHVFHEEGEACEQSGRPDEEERAGPVDVGAVDAAAFPLNFHFEFGVCL